MKYLMTLQWPASAIAEFDVLIGFEDALIENLSDACEVDGHDFGVGEINIFIHTNDPNSALIEIQAIFRDTAFWENLKIGYREMSRSDYVGLWPSDGSKFKVK